MVECSHLGQVRVTELPGSVDGCEECLRSGDGWVHLRICLSCGHVGCCDSSPNRHASAHAGESGHPLIRSIEPGEVWSYCYPDELVMRIDGISGETRIPPSPLGG
ncbi:MAG: UBP-type zinc finger domain-containing protein [Solirubrobacterales bacterium]|nr:UBP-type zinc finger domain-containing protein [Solirubrobacterales bacterium]